MSGGLINLGIGSHGTIGEFILFGLRKKPPPPIYIGKKGKRSTPLARAHPRQAAWDRQLAEVTAQMRDYRNQKEVEAQKVFIREQERQRVLEREAIKLRAQEMERARLDAEIPVTKKDVREIVEEVVDEKLKRKE